MSDANLTPELVRIAPTNRGEASRLALQGAFVDASGIVGDEYLLERTQYHLDHVAQIVNSPDYKDFERQLSETLAGVQNQTFFIDLEDTLAMRVVNNSDFRDQVLVGMPHMISLVRALRKQNRVFFWTSASREMVPGIMATLPPEFADLPIIDREKYIDLLNTILSYNAEELGADDAVAAGQRVFPGFSQGQLEYGKKCFTETRKEKFDFVDYAKYKKMPFLLSDPKTSFLIDDNSNVINNAITRSELVVGSQFDFRRILQAPDIITNSQDIQLIAQTIAEVVRPKTS